MLTRIMQLSVVLLVAAGLAGCERVEQVQTNTRKLTYTEDVAPILQEYCVSCHVTGQRGAIDSGLLMDSYASLMQGSRFGPVINPGSAMTSSLYVLISGKDRLTVTMPHGADPLAPEAVETIRLWIDDGALEE